MHNAADTVVIRNTRRSRNVYYRREGQRLEITVKEVISHAYIAKMVSFKNCLNREKLHSTHFKFSLFRILLKIKLS